MKIQITFKTPDAVERAVAEAVRYEQLPEFPVDGEQDQREILTQDANDVVSKFIKYGEYVTIEIDTDTKTAIVLPVKN